MAAVIVTAGALFGPALATAHAQVIDFASKPAERITFEPGVVFSSGYDTNPWRVSDVGGVYNTVETYVTPQVASSMTLGHLRVHLFGAVEIVKAGEAVVDKNHQFGSNMLWAGPVLAPHLDVTSKHTNANPTGFEVGRKSLRNENDIQGGLTWRLSQAFSLQGFGRYTKTDWDADALYQTSSLREKLNRTDTGFGGRVRLALTPLTSLAVSAERNESRFVYSPIRDGAGYRVTGSIDLSGPAIVNGRVELGVRQFDSRLGDVSFRGLIGNASLSRTLPSETAITVRFERDLQFSFDPSLAYFVGQSTTVTAVQPIGESIAVQVMAGRHRLSYDRPAGGVPLDSVNEYSLVVGRKVAERTWVGFSVEWASANGALPWNERRGVGFITFGSGPFQRLDRPVPFQH